MRSVTRFDEMAMISGVSSRAESGANLFPRVVRRALDAERGLPAEGRDLLFLFAVANCQN